MDDKPVALVTGASRGIGRGIALALAETGHRVVVNYVRNSQAAEEVAALIERSGQGCLLVQGNVADREARERIVSETLGWKDRLDLLVNNAGIASPERLDLLEAKEEVYDVVMDTNLKGPFFLTQKLALEMLSQKKSGKVETPRIVFITSISAYTVTKNRVEYCVSKAGLSLVAGSFALRLAEAGIPVFEIRPGLIETDMTEVVRDKYTEFIKSGKVPQKRWGTPEDVARAVVAIARGEFDFSTGQIFEVGGGFHLREL
jgi:NAD(P)-dependent dehydrogenase (short-subunit alcohol dehydrogenase family)